MMYWCNGNELLKQWINETMKYLKNDIMIQWCIDIMVMKHWNNEIMKKCMIAWMHELNGIQ